MTATSQNGYSAVEDSSSPLLTVYLIPGTQRKLRLRTGAPGLLLVHLAAWFDRFLENIDEPTQDDWGWAYRLIRDSDTDLSNHASGTAMDLNATKHPRGSWNTFSSSDQAKIRAKLTEYDGCVRWGGDYKITPDDMHFEIIRSEEACRATLAKLTAAPAPTPPQQDGWNMATADEVLAALSAFRSEEAARYQVETDRWKVEAQRWQAEAERYSGLGEQVAALSAQLSKVETDLGWLIAKTHPGA